jgi:hypothetical protein
MVKRQQVNRSQIKVSRELTPNDDLTTLANEILAHGLKFPVVVDSDMNLIDGLRRLEALESFALVEDFAVQVVICHTLEDSLSWVSKAQKHGVAAAPVTALRAWQLFSDTYEQQKQRTAEHRGLRKGRPRGEWASIAPLARSRELLNEALGMGPGEAFVAVSTLVYKTFATNTDPRREQDFLDVQRSLEAGNITIYEAKGLLDRIIKGEAVNNKITNPNDQRSALAITLSQITGANKGIALINPIHPDITTAELEILLRGFMEARREITAFINSLRKRITTP